MACRLKNGRTRGKGGGMLRPLLKRPLELDNDESPGAHHLEVRIMGAPDPVVSGRIIEDVSDLQAGEFGLADDVQLVLVAEIDRLAGVLVVDQLDLSRQVEGSSQGEGVLEL